MPTEVGELRAKLSLDTSGFSSGIGTAFGKVKGFTTILNGALTQAVQGFKSATEQVYTLSKALDTATSRSDSFRATIKDSALALRSLQKEGGDLTNNLGSALPAGNYTEILGSMQQSMQSIAAITRSIYNGMYATAGATQQVTAATQQTSAASTQAAAATQRQAAATRQVNKAASTTRTQVASTTKEATRAASIFTRMSKDLNTSSRYAKDLKRIISGIVVSQAFYRIMGIMKSLVSDSISFMKNMEQSAISFKYLLGTDKEDALNYMSSLQDFAIASPLDTTAASKSTKMLMNMGFEAESVISLLQVLTDAAVVSGDEIGDTVYSLTLALGQMLQSGTVKAQEVRQLINANIPVLDILKEELKLNGKQVSAIGKQSVDSVTAVTAIINGLAKRYSGASKEMQETVAGSSSAIKDSFLVMFNVVAEGPYEKARKKIVSLSQAMQYLVSVARSTGAGGVFEALVPKDLQDPIRNLLGSLIQLGRAFSAVSSIIKTSFGYTMQLLAKIFAVILPYISTLVNGLAQLLRVMMTSNPIIKTFVGVLSTLVILGPIIKLFTILWRVLGFSSVVKFVTKEISFLTNAVKGLFITMAASPAGLIIGGIVGALLILITVSKRAREELGRLMASFGGGIKKFISSDKTVNKEAGIGFNPNDILQPTSDKNKKDADKYKQSLDKVAESFKEIGKEANGASKQISNSFNQSFDEIYGIDPKAAGDMGLGLGVGDIDLSGLEDFESAIQDFSDFKFDFSALPDAFMLEWQEMWKKIVGRLKELDFIPLLAGAIAGLATGSVWVGLATALAAFFWPELAAALGLSKTQAYSILHGTFAALLTGVLTKLAGGSLVQAGVYSLLAGTLVHDLFDAIANVQEGDTVGLTKNLLTLLGTAIGGVVGGLMSAGSPIGVAIGMLAGNMMAKLWQEMQKAIGPSATKVVSSGIAVVLAKVAGASSIHMAAAALAGTIVAGLFNALSDGILTDKERVNIAASNFFSVIASSLGLAFGGPMGALVGATLGNIAYSLAGQFYTNFRDGLAKENEVLTTVNTILSSVNTMYQKVDQNIIARKSVREGVQEDYDALSSLVDKAYELSDKKALSESEQTGLLALIAEINKQLPGLNLAYDSTTQSLNKQEGEVDALIKKTKDYYMLQAAQEDIIKIYKDIYQNEKAVAKAKEANTKAQEELNKANAAWDNSSFLDKVGLLGGYTLIGNIENAEETFNKTSTELQNLYTQQTTLTQELSYSQDAASKFNTALSQTPAVATSAANATTKELARIEPAAKKAAIVIPKSISAEKDNAKGAAQQVVNSTMSGLQFPAGTINGIGRTVPASLGTGITSNTSAATTAVETLVEVVTVPAKGIGALFQGFGNNIVEGLKNGIVQKKDNAVKAIQEWTDKIKEKFQNEFGIESPSKWFSAMSGYMIQGSVLGIKKETPKATKAMEGLSTDMKNASDLSALTDTSWLNTSYTAFADWGTKVADVLTLQLARVALVLQSMKQDMLSINDVDLSADYTANKSANIKKATAVTDGNIAQSILEELLPFLAKQNSAGGESLPPMYVGTLIADQAGLKELTRKVTLIQSNEQRRGGGNR